MTGLSRRALLTGAVGMVGTAAVGCSLPSSRPPDSPSPSGPPAVNEPSLPTVTPRRLWAAPQRTGLTDLTSCTLQQGLLVVDGQVDGSSAGLQVIDATTGRVRWTADTVADEVMRRTDGASLSSGDAVVAGAGAAAVVLATTYGSPCPPGKKDLCRSSETLTTSSRGVVALGLTDGSVRWHQVVAPPIPRSRLTSDGEDSAAVVAADGRSVVVAVGSGLVIRGNYAADAENRCRTAVLEAASGKPRWTVPDLLPLAIADDVVITLEPTGRSGQLRGAGPVVALDLQTGARRWSSDDTLGAVSCRAVGSGIVVLVSPVGQIERMHLLDPGSGREHTATLPRGAGPVLVGTSATGEPMAAWTVDGERGPLYTLTLPERDPVVSGTAPFEKTSLIGGRIHRGYVWCSELGQRGVSAVDRSGHRCSDPLSSFLVEAVDDDHLVLLHRGNRDGVDRTGFSIYAVS
jgi:outer membrane protein assembly factor BamB